jgi:hypothetical protein
LAKAQVTGHQHATYQNGLGVHRKLLLGKFLKIFIPNGYFTNAQSTLAILSKKGELLGK